MPHLLSPERPLTNREKSKALGAMRRALAGTGRSEVAVVMRYLFDLARQASLDGELYDGSDDPMRHIVQEHLEQAGGLRRGRG